MNTIIFDLDGTLLPMDQDVFLETYFKALTTKMVPYGIDPKRLIKAVYAGINAMINNDGTMTNEMRFWKAFINLEGEEVRKLEPVFMDFYENDFNQVKSATTTNQYATKVVQILQEKGYELVLATNPLFPRIATQNRIQWAGLKPEDFGWITTYENSSYCKPNLEYYNEVLKFIGKRPEECLMVGNNMEEDMIVSELGIDTYLLKDCLINRKNEDISTFRQGSFKEFYEYVMELPRIQQS